MPQSGREELARQEQEDGNACAGIWHILSLVAGLATGAYLAQQEGDLRAAAWRQPQLWPLHPALAACAVTAVLLASRILVLSTAHAAQAGRQPRPEASVQGELAGLLAAPRGPGLAQGGGAAEPQGGLLCLHALLGLAALACAYMRAGIGGVGGDGATPLAFVCVASGWGALLAAMGAEWAARRNSVSWAHAMGTEWPSSSRTLLSWALASAFLRGGATLTARVAACGARILDEGGDPRCSLSLRSGPQRWMLLEATLCASVALAEFLCRATPRATPAAAARAAARALPPTDGASVGARWLFLYIVPLLALGQKRALQSGDVPDLPPEDQPEANGYSQAFERAWELECHRRQQRRVLRASVARALWSSMGCGYLGC